MANESVEMKIGVKIEDPIPVIDLEKEISSLGAAIQEKDAATPKFVGDPVKHFKGLKKIEISEKMYEDARKENISLSEKLEEVDPSGQYSPIRSDRGEIRLDAFERQLAIRGLSVFGRSAVSLDAFYQNPSNRTLFPEFINRQVRVGRLMATLDAKVADLIAAETSVDSQTYESSEASDSSDNASLKDVKEGAAFPALTISFTEQPVKLRKYGRKIKATYEYLRRQKVNVFAIVLQFIGMRMEKDESAAAVDVLLNGNTGNSNGAGNTNVAAGGTLAYADMVQLLLDMGANGGFDLQKILSNRTRGKGILTMAEFADVVTGTEFARTGAMVTPFGGKFLLADSLATNLVLGVDTRFAMIKVTEEGAALTETQKLIDTQWQEVVISEYIAFVKFFANAARKLTI